MLYELKKSNIPELYTSSLGFSIQLPFQYQIVTGDFAKSHPELFVFEHEKAKEINKSFKAQIKEMFTSGDAEFYYNFDTINKFCTDVITVQRDYKGLPEKGKDLKSYRKALAKELSKAMGMEVQFYNMELKKINNMQILYNEYGIKKLRLYCIQYAIKKSDKECIVLSASFYEKNKEIFKADLKYIIDSFKWTIK